MARIKPPRRGDLRQFFICNSGGVLIYIAFALPLLLGVSALSIDLGRAFILNSELKDFADAAALAGAAELDGTSGACARAMAAAHTGISGSLVNVQAFATNGGGPDIQIDVSKTVCLRNLPADGTDFTAADTATSDVEARFIFVSVVNRSVTSGLSRALGVIPDFETGARSIAGFNGPVICRVPAMLTCNPLEDPNFPSPPGVTCAVGTGVGLQEECLKERQILLKSADDYEPGNFALIEPPGGNDGADFVAAFLASVAPNFCLSGSINTRTGEAVEPVASAINTRFDLYENPKFGWWTDDWGDRHSNPDYRPALNVTKGYTHDDWVNGCVPQGSSPYEPAALPDAQYLPRDSCFATDTCSSGRWGMGDWYQETYDHDGDPNTPLVEPYWEVNHPGVPQPPGYSDMSRYEVYRYEIENLIIPDNSASGGENGNPQCYDGGVYSDPSYDTNDDASDDYDTAYVDRRIMTLAVVNCVANGPLSGKVFNVPVMGAMDIFLTEPARAEGEGGNKEAFIYGEVVNATGGPNAVVHDIVQLYR